MKIIKVSFKVQITLLLKVNKAVRKITQMGIEGYSIFNLFVV
jgi:hypothetical protein